MKKPYQPIKPIEALAYLLDTHNIPRTNTVDDSFSICIDGKEICAVGPDVCDSKNKLEIVDSLYDTNGEVMWSVGWNDSNYKEAFTTIIQEIVEQLIEECSDETLLAICKLLLKEKEGKNNE